MQPLPLRTSLAVLVIALALAAGGAFAQGAPQRIVLAPFDADASVDALALALPAALQRAFNEIDGVYVPPVADVGAVLQRTAAAGADALAETSRVFGADALVLARVRGSDALAVDVVVDRGDGVDRGRVVEGRLGDLPALLRSLAEAVLALAEVTPSAADRNELLRVLEDVPSLPSLGPVGAASARLPGVRVDALQTAAGLDSGSAWVRAELARALVLDGQPDRARQEAEAAVAIADHVEHQVLLGAVLLALGDPGAEAAFESALARNPGHAVALFGLAGAGVAEDRRGALLERAIAAAPRLVDAHLTLAELQTTAARTVQVLRRASESLPDSLGVQAALLDAAVQAGDDRGALALLRAAVADPVGRRAAVFALAGRLPTSVALDALALVRQGIEAFPADANLRRIEVDLLRRTGDAAGAEAALGAWVETGAAAIDEIVSWAETLAARGRLDEAHAWLATVADVDDDADLRSAQIDLAAGRARVVLETLEPSVVAGTADAARRTLYAIALGRVGRAQEAITMLGEVIAEADASGADARTQEAGGLAARARSVLEEQRQIVGEGAVELTQETTEAFEQGLYALEVGELALARDAFARARSLQAVGVIAFYEGYVRQLLGDPRGAVAAYQAARADLGDNDVLLNNLGYAHLQVGRLDLALETLRAAVAANPANARAHLNLGLTFYGLARFGDAVASFDTALELDSTLEASAASVIADARRRATP